jgi:hypothetical protein
MRLETKILRVALLEIHNNLNGVGTSGFMATLKNHEPKNTPEGWRGLS